ncbi:MAG: L-seryl-tRNA(Sec) selenium transferase, partial [Actinobacteria bacterium]|nr:L-seryl-tRNA(Sec) selenium transferase [Actinomycetota bacterium]
MAAENRLRALPSVDALLASDAVSALVERHGRDVVVDAARAALARAREEIHAGYAPIDLAERVAGEIDGLVAPRLRRVLNATGVVVHTNLGRAP